MYKLRLTVRNLLPRQQKDKAVGKSALPFKKVNYLSPPGSLSVRSDPSKFSRISILETDHVLAVTIAITKFSTQLQR